MKNKFEVLSTANITIGISQLLLSVYLMILIGYGLDSKFNHPFVWILLGAVSILITLSIIKKFTFTIELDVSKNTNVLKFKNPFILWCVLGFLPRGTAKISTLTGTYEYFYKNNKGYIIQVNKPNLIDYLKDLLILLLTLIILTILYVNLSKLDIIRYGLSIIFCFTYTSIFVEKLLIKWCYFKISFDHKKEIRISPLMLNKPQLATTVSNKVLISPSVLNYDDNIITYIVQHERGHMKHSDNMKGFLEDICVYSFALIYCYIQITNPNVATLTFIPIIIILFLHPFLVFHIELKADEYAAKQLGIDFCINALNQLSLNFKIKDNQLIEDFSFLGVLLKTIGILKGSVSIESRIKHLKSIKNL